MKSTNAVKKREPHALDSVAILDGAESWESLLRRWKRPMQYDDRLEWLHKDQKRSGNGPERFLFFLELADRYGEDHVFDVLPQNKGFCLTLETYASVADLKSNLGAIAFTILCNKFFAEPEENKAQYPLMLPYKKPLFPKLLWFFRPYGGKGGYDNMRPCNSKCLGRDFGKHYLSVARKFAERFTMNAWNMLNSQWFNCSEETPDLKIAEPYWREIIVLMRHLDLLKHIEHGQHSPTLEVFKKMVQLACEENDLPFNPDTITSSDANLEPRVKEGDSLARALYITRLHFK